MPALRPNVITVGDLVIDLRAKSVTRASQRIDLTAKEYALLEFLAQRSDAVVGRAEIAEHVWDDTFDPFSNLIEVYVQRLRRKTEAHGGSRLLFTRRGQGYILTAMEPADD
jgi:two-component system copper resistance phosphate regulon response regulator CusR